MLYAMGGGGAHDHAPASETAGLQRQIADELGLTVGTVYYWRRLKLGLPAHRDASHKRLRDYTVYDRHGNVAAFGTARECARALGVKVETIYRLASRSARCRDGRVVREPDS